MAITQKSYEEYSHTKFPEAIDDAIYRKDAEGNNTNDTYALPYMTDIDADTMSAMNEYNSAFRNGEYSKCLTILDQENGTGKKKLKYSIFNADKFNLIRDAILALQKFFLQDVLSYINRAVDERLGISMVDVAAGDPISDTVAYSARYLSKEFNITLKLADWKPSTNGGYVQTVNDVKTSYGESITDENYTCYASIEASKTPSEVKAYNKAYAYLYRAETKEDHSVTFYAWKKPNIDFSVILRHI